MTYLYYVSGFLKKIKSTKWQQFKIGDHSLYVVTVNNNFGQTDTEKIFLAKFINSDSQKVQLLYHQVQGFKISCFYFQCNSSKQCSPYL